MVRSMCNTETEKKKKRKLCGQNVWLTRLASEF